MTKKLPVYNEITGMPNRPRIFTSEWPDEATLSVVREVFRLPRKDSLRFTAGDYRYYEFHKIITFAETRLDALRSLRMWITDDNALEYLTIRRFHSSRVDWKAIVDFGWDLWRLPIHDARPVFIKSYSCDKVEVEKRWSYVGNRQPPTTFTVVSDREVLLNTSIAGIPLRYCSVRHEAELPRKTALEYWQEVKGWEENPEIFVRLSVGVREYFTGYPRLFYWHERIDAQ